MKVAIAGAGIGGMTAAIAFARIGASVVLLEQAGELTEVGAGLQLSPNAVNALRAMGADARVRETATMVERLEMRDGRSGDRIFAIPMGAAAERRYGAPYLHVHRADLLQALTDIALSYETVTLRLGARVVGVAQSRAEARAGLDNGDIVAADILLGADGVRSAVRRQTLHAGAPRFTGCVAWRLTVPAEGLDAVFPDRAASVWVGPNRHAVTYYLRDGGLMNFVGVTEGDTFDVESWHETGDLDHVRAAFSDWAQPLQDVLGRAASCNRWALYDRDALPYWSEGRVTLLGDACHPMMPFQAQGAAMAIEDAYVLARCVEEGKADIPAALRRYDALRRPRTTRVMESARANRAIFHRAGALSQLATYGPMKIADRLLPGFVHSRQDWIYAHDVTAMS
ncbi:MAG: FAD-dependent monooxygenase [Hyphomonadaceae bacterium]